MDAISIKEDEPPHRGRSNMDADKPKRTNCHDAQFNHRRQFMVLKNKVGLLGGY